MILSVFYQPHPLRCFLLGIFLQTMKKNEIKRAESWWWPGRPGVLQSMGSQRDLTEWLNWIEAEFGASLVAQTVKNLPAVQQTQVCPDWYYSEKVKTSEDVKKKNLYSQAFHMVISFLSPSYYCYDLRQ